MNDTNQDQQQPPHHPPPLQRRAAHATTNDSFETPPKVAATATHNHHSQDEGEHLVSSTSTEASPPASAAARNAAKGGALQHEQQQQQQKQHNQLQYAPPALSSATAAAAAAGERGPQTMPITSTASRQTRATQPHHPDEAPTSVERTRDSGAAADMVARASKSAAEAASGVANCNRSVSSTVTVEGDAEAGNSGGAIVGHHDNHKLILKLPKTPLGGTSGVPLSSRSNSCHSSSSLLSGAALEEDDDDEDEVVAEDTRKVEPLKIHLGAHHPPLASSDGGSSSAEDDAAPQLKMTIKGSEGEPHIVPKLTIRAEEGGGGSPVVPKLTIKLGEGAADSAIGPPPPLPKLTIKTSHDGTSESIISSVSPALSTSSSSSLTSSVSSCSAPPPPPPCDTNKIPKLTIKTTGGRQDHRIINQVEVPPIPKLTIKTKSVEVEDEAGDGPDEKIPKITIKTSDGGVASERQASPKFCIKSQERPDGGEKPLVPKLTISVANLEGSGAAQMSPKACAPLKVRQVAGGKVESPERVPKLMISRQDSPGANHHHHHGSEPDKLVPKLTIKATNAGDHADPKESKFTIKQKDHDEKVPKLTIKSIPAPGTSEESDDSRSPSKAPPATTNKVVPKLTIKNLSSPQLRMKVVCEEVAQNGKKSAEDEEESGLRRCSDDMDIDEALQQQHAPQVFNNVASGKFPETNGELETTGPPPKATRVVDTVDLTSSPSPGSSPAHFNYTDADPRVPDELLEASTPSLLMERLQRESSVIQTASGGEGSILLNQLIAPGKLPEPPPLQLKPGSNANSLKYPELTERLLANGAVPQLVTGAGNAAGGGERRRPAETVIDSIEILDTPEGSPRSSLDEAPAGTRFDNHQQPGHHHFQLDSEQQQEVLRRNNNTMNNHVGGKRGATANLAEVSPKKARRLEDGHTMATLTIFTNETSPTGTGGPKIITTSPTIIRTAAVTEAAAAAAQDSPKTHRSRKQRHEHLMAVPMDEEEAMVGEPAKEEPSSDAALTTTSTQKRRGRPKKGQLAKMAVPDGVAPSAGAESDEAKAKGVEESGAVAAAAAESPPASDKGKSRRVQLLRKRLAIDMVDSELPSAAGGGLDGSAATDPATETPKREVRPLRQSRRSATPIVRKQQFGGESSASKPGRKRQSAVAAAAAAAAAASAPLAPTPSTTSSSSSSNGAAMDNMLLHATLNHFGGSNSSISSACSSSSFSSATVTTTTTAAAVAGGTAPGQIDLTMCSSSSSSSQHSTHTTTATTAGGHRPNSMLPPTTILSSDPLPDVVFRANDFSAIRGSTMGSGPDSQDEDGSCSGYDRMLGEHSAGEESSGSACSQPMTPGRGRGRGRGRGANAAGSGRGTPGGGGRGSRGGAGGHRLGRGASAVAKAIAMSRPRCVGGLKHTPDPERLKGLFSPSPQVFEEDTRMSADMTPMTPSSQPTDPQTPTKEPPDFLLTNDESQSSILSTGSILDPNNIPSMQHGSAIKRPKKKKMEVCVAEEADFTVASIAEYDWPPPKGCCPSKNRDTFMIQEQVAHYLGIKSFKRKYPDLPRRQVDMEERNWLQEKGLVSEKMCDLGITAVWASDILDIMYTDFYDKYEEYKDYIRQKHLRDIESKQKALGLTLSSGRGLQARDRAMLSASNWNAYFNRSRKEERTACLDLQTLTVNVPAPASAATATMVDRSIAESIAEAARAESIPEPPTLLKPRQWERPLDLDMNYPVAVVPGQFTAKYRHYTPTELRCFPLNTVLEDPRNLYELLQQESNEQLEGGEQAERCSLTEGGATSGMRRVPVRRTRRARGAERNKSQASSSSTEESSSSSSSSGEDSDSDSDSSGSDSGSSAASSATDSASSEDEAAPSLCGVCHRTQHRNLKDVPELFIKCYTCCRKVHPSCIEMPHRMVGRVRSYNWQCADCKCCIKCKRKQDTNKMLYCEQCDRGFHIYCLGAKAVPDGRWSCSRCSVCMRCGATKPEGLPQHATQIKHKKVKWINEYRIDHITKLREHCSMLCVPCARAKPVKRILQSPGAASNATASSPATAAASLASPNALASPSSLSAAPKVPHVAVAPPPTGDKPQPAILKPQQPPTSMNKSHQMFPPAAPLSAAAAPSPLASADKNSSGGVVLAAPPPVVA